MFSNIRLHHALFLVLLSCGLISLSGTGCGNPVPDAQIRAQDIQDSIFKRDSIRTLMLLDSLSKDKDTLPDQKNKEIPTSKGGI